MRMIMAKNKNTKKLRKYRRRSWRGPRGHEEVMGRCHTGPTPSRGRCQRCPVEVSERFIPRMIPLEIETSNRKFTCCKGFIIWMKFPCVGGISRRENHKKTSLMKWLCKNSKCLKIDMEMLFGEKIRKTRYWKEFNENLEMQKSHIGKYVGKR